MTLLLRLNDITPNDRARVGGKGLHLARLARRRLPVPPAVVVPVDAFRRVLRDNQLLSLAQAVSRHPEPAAVARLREGILSARLPRGWARRLERVAERLGGRVAVRSSGIDEDGHVRSFAGQHLTRLGVPPGDVADAVRACWASLYDDRALAYRGGGGPVPGAMAVVIQTMIAPRVAGVMFTINPLSGSWREMVVEATWGLGEGLVSGQVTPHWFLVRRPRRSPKPVQRVLSRVRLQLVQEDLPEIGEQWAIGVDGALVREPTPPARRAARTLRRDALFRLCRLGLRVESELGEPQDVEWAMGDDGALYVLQARPITTTGAPRARPDALWTRRFIGERWPEPATPLGWSIMAPLFEHFIAYPGTTRRHLGGDPALKLVRSRPYVNVTVFRHLAFKLPGAPPPSFMLEFFPPEEERDWQRRFAVLPDFAVYASILRETLVERRWRRFAWNPINNPLRWDVFEASLDAALPGLSREPVSRHDALTLVREQIERIREYIGIHIASLLFANLFWQLLDGALANQLPEQSRHLMDALATTPPGNRTLATNEALWALSREASDADLDALERGERPGGAFGERLGAFLREFGHRSSASWEVFTPRWVEEPARIVPLLRAHRAGAMEEPAVRAQRQEQAYEDARRELRALLSSARHEVVLTEALVHYTRRYLLLRENQRFAFDRLLFALKRTLTWLGGRFASDGVIDRADDVAFLTLREVEGLATDALSPTGVRERVARRRAERERDAAVEPPAFLRGDEVTGGEPDGARLQGLGISPGRYRGRVRVVRSLADGERVQPGEVLVARAVDPAWTPLFLTAGAVVLEMGSRLSHGAVVAREYKVPGVVNLDGVTRRLSDGQEVTVDGGRGIVWVHDG